MMSSTVRRYGSAFVTKKAFSSVSPKIAVGQHLLRLDEIFHAADEAALTKIAASPLPTVDPSNLPAQLKDLASWYALDNVSASDKFIPDAAAWQNKDFWTFAVDEAQRDETWPFLAGFVVMGLLWWKVIDGLPESARKESKYIQMCEGTYRPGPHGHDDHAEHGADHGHGADCHNGECKVAQKH